MNFIETYKNKAVKIFQNLLENDNLHLGFLKNSIFQRWIIAVTLCLILAIMMAPEVNFSEPQFKPGMIASRNIKADHSFLVEDKQATEQKKLEDAENVKPIYNYDGKTADNIKTNQISRQQECN